jgi:hypothetical protein
MRRGHDHVRAEGNRRRERYSGASHALVSLVPDEDSKLLEIAGLPVAEVSFFNRHASGNAPAKFAKSVVQCLTFKLNVVVSCQRNYCFGGMN